MTKTEQTMRDARGAQIRPGSVLVILVALAACGSESTAPPEQTVDNHRPWVEITTPPDGLILDAGLNYLGFGATATDVEDGDLTDSIHWTSSIDGAMGTGESTSPLLSMGTHTITATVEDSEGLSDSAHITVTVPYNAPPIITITSPGDGSRIGIGPVQLVGQARDPEMGDLSSYLRWQSSLDGPIGFGSTSWITLSAGVHTITASVEDWGGKTGTGSVTVTVGEELERDTVKIVSRRSHTCAVSSSDEAYCWGLNDDGQIGDGTTDQADSPTAIAAWQATWRVLSAGDAFTCGIHSVYGTTYCWGANAQHQLGNGSTAPSTGATAVPFDYGFVTLTSGVAHTCALTYSSLAYCWGTNEHGEIGNGGSPDNDAAVPTAVAGGHGFVDIAASDHATCGIAWEGQTWCWGADGGGGLGVGTVPDGAIGEPVMIDGAPDFVQLTGGGNHMCGLTEAGAAYCWGENHDGQIGNGGTDAVVTAPTAVLGGLSFTEIDAGARHTCALVETGAAYCWGTNGLGELGIGSNDVMATSPHPVAGGLYFETLAAGWRNTCGITKVGDATYCWGDAYAGALGDGGVTSPLAYEPIATDPF